MTNPGSQWEVTTAWQKGSNGGPPAMVAEAGHIRACKYALPVGPNTKQSWDNLSSSLVRVHLRAGFMTFVDEQYHDRHEETELTHHKVEKSREFTTSQLSASSFPNVPPLFQWSAHLNCGVS
jgi:hypothetical protein